jgi:hypothetical protein
MMKRMFGLRPDGVAAGVAFCACASASEVSVAAATSVDVPSSRFLRSMVRFVAHSTLPYMLERPS